MGSKARIANDIMPIILRDRQHELYVEPFVGGANTFHLVSNPKWGNDLNHYVVAMLEAVGQGWVPPGLVTEGDYNRARCDVFMDPELRGFIGIGASYSGKFFGGYARGNDAKGNPRNYAMESRNNILRQAGGLHGARFTSMPYWEMDIPDGSVVYCDPPYGGVTRYSNTDPFDTDKFWEWAADLSRTCRVFVSEYSAPPGWTSVWQSRAIVSSLTKDTGSKTAVEQLWRLRA